MNRRNFLKGLIIVPTSVPIAAGLLEVSATQLILPEHQDIVIPNLLDYHKIFLPNGCGIVESWGHDDILGRIDVRGFGNPGGPQVGV